MPLQEVVVGRDEDDLKKHGKEATLGIGKHLVGSGEDAHLTTPVLLDVLRPHVITLCGKRGEGKSYSMGIIAEEISNLPQEIRNNLCVIMIDTQGIFWTMKYPNEKDVVLLREWGMEAKGFPVTVYIPEGQERVFSDAGVEFDATFSFLPSELTAEDWMNVFSLNANEPARHPAEHGCFEDEGRLFHRRHDISNKIRERL